MRFPFTDMTGRGVWVAVVDSGIVQNHPRIGPVAGGVALTLGRDGVVVYGDDYADCAGHGTACAGIIRRKAPEAVLYSIRVFDQTLATHGRLLIEAVEWAIAHGMDLVNLSLGTTDVVFRDAFVTVCRKATERGIILVSAEHNGGRDSYPALLPEVIGVGAGNVRGKYDYHYRPGADIECIARGDSQRVCWREPPEIMMGGTSFAAPHVTGLIALIRQAHSGASLNEVRGILKNHALPEPEAGQRSQSISSSRSSTNTYMGQTFRKATDGFSWIRKAALYPFNKEMHALVRARDYVGFKIVGVADPVGKGLVGKDAAQVIGLSASGIRVAPRLSAALEGADTLILGYVDELSRIRKRDFLRECVKTALDHNLHVFSLLALGRERYGDLHEVAETRGLRIYYPELTAVEAKKTLDEASSFPQVDVPVLAVVGTSSQQGKFTLQLALRHRFLELGYRVGQVGTEHHAELFGMDCAFPMGYASSIRIPIDWYVPFLDAKMREISHLKKPHLLLVGTQSGTVPYDVHEPKNQTLPTIAFLMGAKPDACVLVVNSVDADDYIRDTIDGIRALCHAPTLLLAMPDRKKHIHEAYGRTAIKPRRMDEEEIHRKLLHLERTFGLPAVCITDRAGIHRAVDEVVEFFAKEEKNG